MNNKKYCKLDEYWLYKVQWGLLCIILKDTIESKIKLDKIKLDKLLNRGIIQCTKKFVKIY